MKRPVAWFGLAMVFGEILGFIMVHFLREKMQSCAVVDTVFGSAGYLTAESIAGYLTAAGIAGCLAAAGFIWISVCKGRKRKRLLEKVCFLFLPVFVLWGGMNVVNMWKTECILTEAVDEMPDMVCGTVIECETKTRSVRLTVRATLKAYPGSVIIVCLVPVDEVSTSIVPWDRVMIRGKVTLFERATNPGCYDAYEVYRTEGTFYQIKKGTVAGMTDRAPVWMQRIQSLRRRMISVFQKSLDADRAGILAAMVTGDKSLVNGERGDLYKSQGIAHIMAISGLHVTMAGLGIGKLLKGLYMPAPFRQAGAVAVVILYLCMCGFSVSSVRAVIMFAAALGGEICGRKADRVTTLALAGMWILIRQPLALCSFSFLMSFGCIGSLLLMDMAQGENPEEILNKGCKETRHKGCRRKQNGNRSGNRSFQWSWAGFYIAAVTVPVLAWFQYEVSLYSVVVNMAVVPAMSLLFPLGLIGGLAGCVCFPMGKLLCTGAGVILGFYGKLCHFTERLPLSVIVTGRPSVTKCVVIYGGFLLFVLLSVTAERISVAAGNKMVRCRYGLLLMYLLLFLHVLPEYSEMIYVDVGQGDCSIIRAADGSVLMIDGGSTSEDDVGKYTIQKVLKFYGIGKIDYVILSHMDQDHVNGILWLLENHWQIGQLAVPGVVCNEEMLAQLASLAGKNHIPVSVLCQGDTLQISDMVLTCLHPAKNFGTDSDNAASAVILLTCGQYSFLYTGDVEGDGEKEMAAYIKAQMLHPGEEDKYVAGQSENIMKNRQICILKVAHHGSKNSTTKDFLSLIQPQWGIISCGKNNSYGHPHDELLDRLSRAGCKTLVTAECGAVMVRCDGEQVSVYTYGR